MKVKGVTGRERDALVQLAEGLTHMKLCKFNQKEKRTTSWGGLKEKHWEREMQKGGGLT